MGLSAEGQWEMKRGPIARAARYSLIHCVSDTDNTATRRGRKAERVRWGGKEKKKKKKRNKGTNEYSVRGGGRKEGRKEEEKQMLQMSPRFDDGPNLIYPFYLPPVFGAISPLPRLSLMLVSPGFLSPGEEEEEEEEEEEGRGFSGGSQQSQEVTDDAYVPRRAPDGHESIVFKRGFNEHHVNVPLHIRLANAEHGRSKQQQTQNPVVSHETVFGSKTRIVFL
ncbi:hypothetical protein F2P81_018946 [Scophthalmus maximus]|uniref:Uncharacterized protein n=1 Tax=Scophthalmus maximus TaxID=52904 RepID=A0A6A4SFA7_SCOMX|nr:hypothetical protein F2P81_018946 [Scophthalmus maximus]